MAKQRDLETYFEIPIRAVKRGLKTAAYLPQLDVSNISDLAILASFDRFDEIQRQIGVEKTDFQCLAKRANDRFAHLVISRRFNFTAAGTKALSFPRRNFCLVKLSGHSPQMPGLQKPCASGSIAP
jgi:hypothetical protein